MYMKIKKIKNNGELTFNNKFMQLYYQNQYQEPFLFNYLILIPRHGEQIDSYLYKLEIIF